MGTTLVAIAYYEGEFYWMNCGDSRYYSMNSKGELHQISTDHSLNNLLGKREHSNVITNCIGGGCKTSYIDLVRCTPDIVAGGTLLLCSDGLTDMVSDDTIQQMLADGCEASALCRVAEDAGGFDNVSAVIIRVS
jgi:protein phosphatase